MENLEILESYLEEFNKPALISLLQLIATMENEGFNLQMAYDSIRLYYCLPYARQKEIMDQILDRIKAGQEKPESNIYLP